MGPVFHLHKFLQLQIIITHLLYDCKQTNYLCAERLTLRTLSGVFNSTFGNAKKIIFCSSVKFPKLVSKITAVIILARTPKIRLECLLRCKQSQVRSSHHRNHRQRTVSDRSWNKLFSFCLRIQTALLGI